MRYVIDTPEPIVKGEYLVPTDTPKGPPEARLAWAQALGTVIRVVHPPEEATPWEVGVLTYLPGGRLAGRVVRLIDDKPYERP